MLFHICFLLLFVLPFVFFSFLLRRRKKLPACGPRKWPLLGMLPGLLHNINRLQEWLHQLLQQTNNTTFEFSAPGVTILVTSDVTNLKYVLKTNFANFGKGHRFREVMHDVLGDSLLLADGARFRRLGATVSAAITSAGFRSYAFATAADTVTGTLLPDLHRATGAGAAVDLQKVLMNFTFVNMAIAGMGVNPAHIEGDFLATFEPAMELSVWRLVQPPVFWKTLRALRLGHERRLHAAAAGVKRWMHAAMALRRQQFNYTADCLRGARPMDLLSAIALLDPLTYGGEDEDELATMGLSIVLAGKDTLAVALTWFFWALQREPRVERAILEELRRVAPGRRHVTMEETKKMHYLQAALSETLRLYPAAPLNVTQALNADVLPDGTPVPCDAFLVYSIQAIGRSPALWGDDSGQFLPERWLRNGQYKVQSEMKFMAFNAGPRRCQGRELAFAVMKFTAASVLLRFEITSAVDSSSASAAAPKLGFNAVMKNGFPVFVRPRTESLHRRID